jgi:acetyl-CoA carboxylase carboxyl transferase subunit beta
MRIGARAADRGLPRPRVDGGDRRQRQPEDPLRFKDSKRYKDRLAAAQKSTGERTR